MPARDEGEEADCRKPNACLVSFFICFEGTDMDAKKRNGKSIAALRVRTVLCEVTRLRKARAVTEREQSTNERTDGLMRSDSILLKNTEDG